MMMMMMPLMPLLHFWFPFVGAYLRCFSPDKQCYLLSSGSGSALAGMPLRKRTEGRVFAEDELLLRGDPSDSDPGYEVTTQRGVQPVQSSIK